MLDAGGVPFYIQHPASGIQHPASPKDSQKNIDKSYDTQRFSRKRLDGL
jgi:hypothetical protein